MEFVFKKINLVTANLCYFLQKNCLEHRCRSPIYCRPIPKHMTKCDHRIKMDCQPLCISMSPLWVRRFWIFCVHYRIWLIVLCIFSVFVKIVVKSSKGLDSIDENSMTYAADIFFAQTWKDHRLRLPENMTQEYRLIEVDWLKNMWRPDSWVFKKIEKTLLAQAFFPNTKFRRNVF